MLLSVTRNFWRTSRKNLKHLSTACPVSQDKVADSKNQTWEDAKPYHEIPGPRPLPLIGNLHRFLPYIGEYYSRRNDDSFFLNKMAQDFGKIVRMHGILGRPDLVFLYDPVEVEKVYRNAGQWPSREGIPSLLRYRKDIRNDFYNGVYGLLITEGEEWYNFRTVVNQVLMRPNIAKLYIDGIDKVAEDFIERIRYIRDSNDEMPENFTNELNKWSLESLGFVALDTRFGCLEKDLPMNSEQQKLITATLDWFELWYRLDAAPSLYKWLDTRDWKKFIATMDYINKVAMKYIDEAVHRIENKSNSEEGEKSVLERLIAIDKRIACVMALDMLQAGIDTTSQSVSKVLYLLAINPDKQEILRKELKEVAPDGKINAENSNKLPYLRACIKEAFRITPAIYANQRSIQNDMVISGYRMPKGTRIVLCHMNMSNMEEYISEPKKYIPERWLRSRAELANMNKFVMMPFGFGSRSCIGKRFAEMEIEALVTKIVTKFEISWNYEEMEYLTKIIMNDGKPLKFKLTDKECVK